MSQLDVMLETNERQKQYYENADGAHTSSWNGRATNAWRGLRGTFFQRMRAAKLAESIIDVQREWIAPAANGAKVLDLGVGDGNPLTFELAEVASDYVAIDLSDARLETVRGKFDELGLTQARAMAVDFLSDDFAETDFGAAYVVGVAHHFADLDAFLKILHSKLTPGAVVLTHDPLNTWLPIKAMRKAYEPFQDDADWEWPFDEQALDLFRKYFEVEEIRGIYGRSKWAVPISFVNGERGADLARQWHEHDMTSTGQGESYTSCLQVMMKLRRS